LGTPFEPEVSPSAFYARRCASVKHRHCHY
jgi:hypothetical protein